MATKGKVLSDEIQSIRFNTVRLHTGYSMEEVDNFIDRVEETLRSYEEKEANREDTVAQPPPPAPDNSILESELQYAQERINELESQLEQANRAAEKASEEASVLAENNDTALESEELKKRDELIEHLEETNNKLVEELREDSTKKASRMLEMATRNYESMINEAEAEKQKILEEAKVEHRELVESLEEDTLTLQKELQNLEESEQNSRAKLKEFYLANLSALEKMLAEVEESHSTPDSKEIVEETTDENESDDRDSGNSYPATNEDHLSDPSFREV